MNGNSRWKRFGWGLSFFLLGGIASFLVFRWTGGANVRTGFFQTSVRESGYQFISPLLECESAEGIIGGAYNFRTVLKRTVEDLIHRGTVDDMAVYYRDLMNGPWFGINEQDSFLPASLLKVPIAMALLKLGESDPTILGKKVSLTERFSPPEDKVQLVPPSREIEVGREYTISELIEAAVERSDNQAALLLYENTPPAALHDVYQSLGVPEDVLVTGDATLSAKQYASFFRILFNASYLSHEHSENLLRLLSRTEFQDGIVAGVPAGVPVAHKFGESGTMAEHQLHDCGIVYYPRRPYLLCLMSRGNDLEALKTSIRTISRTTYDEVSRVTQ